MALTTKSTASAVPIKLVPAEVPALPVVDHVPIVLAVTHEALPFASEVSTLPADWVPSASLNVPVTSSVAAGAALPMPKLPPLS